MWTLLAIILAASNALATPVPHPISSTFEKRALLNYNNWSPAGPGDVRSPCPMLNSLANQNFGAGYFPHDGKNISLPMVLQTFKDAINVGPDFGTALGAAAIAVGNPTAGTFNLDDLDLHNYIEHDASLSRGDAFAGDNHSFNQTIFNVLLNHASGSSVFNPAIAATTHKSRLDQSQQSNPQFVYTPLQMVLSYGEPALFLNVMGSPITSIAPVNYVTEFFEKERLPTDLGWSKPLAETNFPSLAATVLEMELAVPYLEFALPGIVLDSTNIQNALKKAFTGQQP